jgi:Skp family chaperone for outer membrane proteins
MRERIAGGAVPMSRIRVTTVAVLALVAGIAQAGAAAAQSSKIGLIDTRRLITQSAQGKQIIAKLQKLGDEKQGQLKARADEITALKKKIDEGRVSLSDDKISAMEKDLEEKTTAGRRLQEDLQRELEEAQQQAFGEFEQKVAPIIEQYGKENGFAFILNVGFFNQPNLPSGIVWADASSDITGDLIKKLDATLAAAPKPAN